MQFYCKKLKKISEKNFFTYFFFFFERKYLWKIYKPFTGYRETYWDQLCTIAKCPNFTRIFEVLIEGKKTCQQYNTANNSRKYIPIPFGSNIQRIFNTQKTISRYYDYTPIQKLSFLSTIAIAKLWRQPSSCFF